MQSNIIKINLDCVLFCVLFKNKDLPAFFCSFHVFFFEEIFFKAALFSFPNENFNHQSQGRGIYAKMRYGLFIYPIRRGSYETDLGNENWKPEHIWSHTYVTSTIWAIASLMASQSIIKNGTNRISTQELIVIWTLVSSLATLRAAGWVHKTTSLPGMFQFVLTGLQRPGTSNPPPYSSLYRFHDIAPT